MKKKRITDMYIVTQTYYQMLSKLRLLMLYAFAGTEFVHLSTAQKSERSIKKKSRIYGKNYELYSYNTYNYTYLKVS